MLSRLAPLAPLAAVAALSVLIVTTSSCGGKDAKRTGGVASTKNEANFEAADAIQADAIQADAIQADAIQADAIQADTIQAGPTKRAAPKTAAVPAPGEAARTGSRKEYDLRGGDRERRIAERALRERRSGQTSDAAAPEDSPVAADPSGAPVPRGKSDSNQSQKQNEQNEQTEKTASAEQPAQSPVAGKPNDGKPNDGKPGSSVPGREEPGREEPGISNAKREENALTLKQRIDNILSKLDRRPEELPKAMFFRYWGDNSFIETSHDALSTFGVDVDTASYTLGRNYLYQRGVLPPARAVRTEEFVNYFKGGYEPPKADAGAFAIHTDLAPSPFAHDEGYQLLRVGLKAFTVTREKRQACSLVFVVDTSGSMRSGNRLELVKSGLRLLVNELDEGDKIGIVAFDRKSRVILEPTDAGEKERILAGINSLHPRSNTNLNAGMTMGYDMAARHFDATASNRVLLLSDGVANTGTTDRHLILQNVSTQRAKGIYLTTIGVGMGNHNDVLLEQLADKGNGQCVYVDRIDEARKVFVDNLTGTLQAVAKDVKIQLEFDKERVLRYRQIGYENRAVADKDFRNNKVDAGEVGAGHEVTALYEIKLAKDTSQQKVDEDPSLATVRVRYLTIEHGEAVELEQDVHRSALVEKFENAAPRFQLAACVAEFSEILRDSYWARGSDLDKVADRVEGLGTSTEVGADKDVVELIALMRKADALVRVRNSSVDEVAMVVDAIQENNWMQARAQTLPVRTREESLQYIEDLRKQSAQLRARLENLMSN